MIWPLWAVPTEGGMSSVGSSSTSHMKAANFRRVRQALGASRIHIDDGLGSMTLLGKQGCGHGTCRASMHLLLNASAEIQLRAFRGAGEWAVDSVWVEDV